MDDDLYKKQLHLSEAASFGVNFVSVEGNQRWAADNAKSIKKGQGIKYANEFQLVS